MRMLDMLRAMDAYVEHDSGGVEELARDTGACDAADADEPTVTCHKCGAPVESDALARQTMADGSLMWPQPFCRACLLAGLKRLKAWLATGGAGAMGEDGE